MDEISKTSQYTCNNFSCEYADIPLSGVEIIENEGKCPGAGCGQHEFTEIDIKPEALSEDSKRRIKIITLIMAGIVLIGGVIWFLIVKPPVPPVPQVEEIIDELKESSVIEEPKETVEVVILEPEVIAIGSGTINLPYGKYEGEIKNGKPHGQGTLTYNKREQVSKKDIKERYAEKGQYLTGSFENGEVIIGRLFDEQGTLLEVMNIGKI